MTKRDVSSHMATLTLQQFDEKITEEMTKLSGLARDFHWASIFLLIPVGACISFFDAPVFAGFLAIGVLYLNQCANTANLEASMPMSNWWLALLIQRQSNDLLAIRRNLV